MTQHIADTSTSLSPQILTVAELLKRDVKIPDYQRPYKWSIRNVDQLISDIDTFRTAGRYRLGTVILHQDDKGSLNIVDGQQRFMTFCLIAHHLTTVLDTAMPETSHVEVPEVGFEISRANLRANYGHINEILSGRPDIEEWAEFFFDCCEIVVLTVSKIDEAFQMFDSQNTRGRALYPTDLLKAFHIREMTAGRDESRLRQAMVNLWEDIPPESIHALFSDYLFKIKRWANGQNVPSQGFSTEHVGLFKGIREADPSNADNRWALPYLYAKNYTDDFAQENSTLIRYKAMPPLEYPFQIDQPVLNGETFFRMVRHYYDLGRDCGLFVDESAPRNTAPPAGLRDVLKQLDPHRHKHTHLLVRNLFDCLVLYYVDRFGEQDLERATRLIARYSMALRVQQKQVRRDMVSNYSLGSPPSGSPLTAINLFHELRVSLKPKDFLQQTVGKPDPNGYDELEYLFRPRAESRR